MKEEIARIRAQTEENEQLAKEAAELKAQLGEQRRLEEAERQRLQEEADAARRE